DINAIEIIDIKYCIGEVYCSEDGVIDAETGRTAAAIAQVDCNDEIYQRQRGIKENLSSLENLKSVRDFILE
ncbi:hypothetical protein ACUJ10_004876, partial [Escherichia coli]